MPAKVTSENGDELHYTTCNEVLSRIKCSQAGKKINKFRKRNSFLIIRNENYQGFDSYLYRKKR